MSAIIYLINRFFFRIWMFLKHWYKDGSKKFFHTLVSFLEYLDRFFAIEITFKNIFAPLYQDRSFIGYIMGFLLRTMRVFLALIVYSMVVSAFAVLYLTWLAIPFFIVFKIFESYGIL
jgi:hypothetical protein